MTPRLLAHDCASYGGSRVESDLDLTVVVPTRNESDNIAPLVRRLDALSPEIRFAVLFVDDSSDDTPRVIKEEAMRCSRSVSVLHRPEGERAGGLGGAVKLGLLSTRSELICVMDADLQHPPEVLEELVCEARRSGADLVVASRFGDRGQVGNFSAFRLGLSRASAIAAKAMFPRRLHAISDPMSGFFLFRRSAVDTSALHPNGFKVLLEILLSGSALTTSEVPFRFGDRQSGDSKASIREGATYLRRLVELRARSQPIPAAGSGVTPQLTRGRNLVGTWRRTSVRLSHVYPRLSLLRSSLADDGPA